MNPSEDQQLRIHNLCTKIRKLLTRRKELPSFHIYRNGDPNVIRLWIVKDIIKFYRKHISKLINSIVAEGICEYAFLYSNDNYKEFAFALEIIKGDIENTYF